MNGMISILLGAMLLWGQGGFSRRVVSGQKVCFADFKHPCYKIAYFQDLSSRVGFQEARQACESDGGALLSLESETEQKLIESMLQNLTKPDTGISDGDFWIGLWRNGEGQTSGACPNLYKWSDGSSSQYRNWYTDEPSCGSEACVVMYHQPTANPGLGGPYLYQWNDDRCNMKHNFICKYEPGCYVQKFICEQLCFSMFSTSLHFGRWTDVLLSGSYLKPFQLRIYQSLYTAGLAFENKDHLHITMMHWKSFPTIAAEKPFDTSKPEDPYHIVVTETGIIPNLIYVVIPTIPLLLLILVAFGTCCFQMLHKSKGRTKTSPNQSTLWISKSNKKEGIMEI